MRSTFYLLVLILFIFPRKSASQDSLNDYKYVIVEDQFHFQNEPNEYDLNRLARFLFEKYGFKSLIEGQALPDDLKANYCLALRSTITARGAFRTKGKIVLRDCNSRVIWESAEGVTKEKDFKRAYDQAIRKAFESFEGIEYNYTPNKAVIAQGEEEDVEVVDVPTETKVTPAKPETIQKSEKKNESMVIPPPPPPKEIEKPKMVEKPMPSEKIQPIETKVEPYFILSFSETTEEGFLTHSTDDVNLVVLPTALEDVYIINNSNKLLFKSEGKWYISKSKPEGVSTKEIDLRDQ